MVISGGRGLISGSLRYINFISHDNTMTLCLFLLFSLSSRLNCRARNVFSDCGRNHGAYFPVSDNRTITGDVLVLSRPSQALTPAHGAHGTPAPRRPLGRLGQ